MNNGDRNNVPQLKRVIFSNPTPHNGKPRILLVHGTMDRSGSFRRAAKHLGDYEVISYDRRGYGESLFLDDLGEPLPVNATLHLQDLLEIIKEKPTVVFGHSYGGTLSLFAAERHAPNLLGLITFEAPLPWKREWANQPAYSISPNEPIDRLWARNQAEDFMKQVIGERNWSRLPPKTRETRRSEGITMVSEMNSLSHILPVLDPLQIEIPVIIARSENASQRHVEAARYLLDNTKNSFEEVISDSDHGVHLSRPEEVARLVKEMVTKLA